MKNFVLLAGSIFSIASFGAAPNIYNCEGGNMEFHYATTSFAGNPTISIFSDGKKVELPAKTEIKRTQSPMGTLVSVSDFRMTMVDGPEKRYTVILPTIQLKTGDVVKFDTMLIKSSVANPLFGPREFTGAVEHNKFVPIQCEAEKVFF